jgi:hypothetical protein
MQSSIEEDSLEDAASNSDGNHVNFQSAASSSQDLASSEKTKTKFRNALNPTEKNFKIYSRLRAI